MAISRADLFSFITELVTRNPTMGIPALEDGLFVNLLFFRFFISVSGFLGICFPIYDLNELC